MLAFLKRKGSQSVSFSHMRYLLTLIIIYPLAFNASLFFAFFTSLSQMFSHSVFLTVHTNSFTTLPHFLFITFPLTFTQKALTFTLFHHHITTNCSHIYDFTFDIRTN